MPYSSDVANGDTILATQYNNLRRDILSGHDHDGVNSAAAKIGVRAPGTVVANNLLVFSDGEVSASGVNHGVQVVFSPIFDGSLLLNFQAKISVGGAGTWYVAQDYVEVASGALTSDYTEYSYIHTNVVSEKSFIVSVKSSSSGSVYIKEVRAYCAWKARISLASSTY